MAETKAVATKEQSAQLPAGLADDFEAMAGMGAENVTQNDMQIPFLAICQSLSPERNKQKPEYIQGLEEGDFFNKATGKMWKGDGDGVLLIPIMFEMQYLKWTPRDKGGGFGGAHPASILEQCSQDEKGTYWLPDGDFISPTATWLMLLLQGENEFEQVIVSLASTQLKKSKKLITTLKGVRLPSNKNPGQSFEPPFFYNVLKATTVPEQNDQGSWMGWKFELIGNITKYTSVQNLMSYARDSHKAYTSGTTRAAYETQNNDQGGGRSVDQGRTIDAEDDGDIPF